jgi:hypothetical protein
MLNFDRYDNSERYHNSETGAIVLLSERMAVPPRLQSGVEGRPDICVPGASSVASALVQMFRDSLRSLS